MSATDSAAAAIALRTRPESGLRSMWCSAWHELSFAGSTGEPFPRRTPCRRSQCACDVEQFRGVVVPGHTELSTSSSHARSLS
jgi:hypothetical protein